MKLFHVKDSDRPMFVVAADWQDALQLWKAKIEEENPRPEDVMASDWVIEEPQGIDFVAGADDLLIAPRFLKAGDP